MPVTIKLNNRVSITLPASKVKEIFQEVSFFASDFPAKCGNCGKENIMPKHRLTKDGDAYYEAVCADCHYTFPFGQYKEGGGLFPKNDIGWKPPYRKGDGERAYQPTSNAPEADDSDVPF